MVAGLLCAISPAIETSPVCFAEGARCASPLHAELAERRGQLGVELIGGGGAHRRCGIDELVELAAEIDEHFLFAPIGADHAQTGDVAVLLIDWLENWLGQIGLPRILVAG